MIPIYPEIRLKTCRTVDTLENMREIMDKFCMEQRFRNLAVRIVSGVRPKDRIGEAQAVQDWIHSRIDYRWDPIGTEWIQYPGVTITERAGDCDDMAILAGCLLQSLGHECAPLAVHWHGQDTATHAVILDRAANVIVDPVAGICVSAWPPAPYRVKKLLEAVA